jgi:hypothetical protein
MCDKAKANRMYKEYRYNLRLQIQSIYGGKCARCGETDPNVLTLHRIFPSSEWVYRGLTGGGWELYRELLQFPVFRQFFNLLCMNCVMIAKLEKMNYFTDKTDFLTVRDRERKQKICQLYDNRCSKCKRQFPYWIFTIDHPNGDGGTERHNRKINGVFKLPYEELVVRLNSGELRLCCPNCNMNYRESSKWITLAMSRMDNE